VGISYGSEDVENEEIYFKLDHSCLRARLPLLLMLLLLLLLLLCSAGLALSIIPE